MFITVEGIDGSGTTTIANELHGKYDRTTLTTEPYPDSSVSEILRANLSCNYDQPLVDFYLFMADRKEHLNTFIEPELSAGQTVICDRYVDSTRAYQPIALKSERGPFDSMWNAKSFIEQNMGPWIIEPDVTLYLDISIDTALERATGDEKYEEREFLEQVKENYDALAESKSFGDDRIVRIDAEQPIEDVVADSVEAIERFK